MRVDFYLLPDTDSLTTACRLLDKAYQRGHKVYVNCHDQQQAEILDERLWTFKDNSFIPHNLITESLTPPPPIQIGYGGHSPPCRDILLNLCAQPPSQDTTFSRIIEIIPNDEQAKQLARVRYKFYKNEGCELHSHQI